MFAVQNIKQIIQPFKNVVNQQIRTTVTLKRRYPPFLHKKDSRPKKLRSKHYIYEIVRDTQTEKLPLMKLILTTNVDGLGSKGDVVEVKSSFGYNNLILLKKAVYASDENIEKMANLDVDPEDKPSSRFVPLSIQSLQKLTLSVVMNKETPWTLQPWHVRVSFRKCGWEMPESAITIPDTPITGPDMNLENKEFIVTVHFSPKEKQDVKCRIHHWSTDPSERLPFVKDFWKVPTDSVFSKVEDTN